ncbi:hypothetical protein N9N03_00195 [Chlamydiia bacterium]|nr:hypothetical protein [Chlamydiia bacterium]
MLKSRFFFIFLLIILAVTGCTKKSVLIGRTFYHEYGFEMSQKDWYKHGQNGQIVEIHNDGIKKTYSYSLGELDGLTDETFPYSDTVCVSSNHKSGILLDKTFFYRSGLPKKEITYFDQMIKINAWFEDGSPMYRESYANNLVTNAVYFSEDGSIEGEVIDGSGKRIFRNENTTKVHNNIIENNNIIAVGTFYENGAYKDLIEYQDGDLHGKATYYTITGQPYLIENYQFGTLNGNREEYQDGFLVRNVIFVSGKKSGVEDVYFDGHVIESTTWYNGYKHGTVKYFYNDVLTRVDYYDHGKRIRTENVS